MVRKRAAGSFIPQVRVACGAGKLQYWSGSGFVDIGDDIVVDASSEIHWHFLKVLVDFTNEKYSTVQFDNVVNDISTIDLPVGVADTELNHEISISISPQDSSPRDCYIDDILVTING